MNDLTTASVIACRSALKIRALFGNCTVLTEFLEITATANSVTNFRTINIFDIAMGRQLIKLTPEVSYSQKHRRLRCFIAIR